MKPKFFLLTTIPISLDFFKGQIKNLSFYFDITLISSDEPNLEFIAEREGVKSRGVNMKRNISLFHDIISLFKLILYFLREKPKVIHCNTPKASFLALLAGYITGVPHRIYYLHGLRFEGSKGIVKKILIIIEKLSCSCATEILAVSFSVKQVAEQVLTSKEITVLHNGTPNGMFIAEYLQYSVDREEVRRELNIHHSDFVFGFVGRLVGDKGINELVEAFNKLSSENVNVKLILVGYFEERLDPLKESTIRIIDKDPNIIYLGYQRDVKKYLSILNIFVSSSYREGLPICILEANLMGVPVLATNINAHAEIVQDGYNGFLVPKMNTYDLYIKMREMLENRDQISSMSDNCRSVIMNKYDHSDLVTKALDYYKRLSV